MWDRRANSLASLLVCAFAVVAHAQEKLAEDPLPSWNDGPAKQSIVEFVHRVASEGETGFVPPDKRIATFDNDGTLWCEKPMYFQALFAFDRTKALAEKHPEWREQEPYQSVLSGDMKQLAAQGEKGLLEIIAATHSGMSVDEFQALVREWMRTARHPRFDRPYNRCIYQPMVEVLEYLRANGFKTFIVSGGGADFMRPWAPAAYGIPPSQIVGSCGKLKYEVRDGQPTIFKLPEVDFVDDKAGKPVGIQRFIGQRPIIAFGNSDGDFEMLQWTTSFKQTTTDRPTPRLGLLVHHTDAEREYAYDNPSPVGQLKRGLEEAPKNGWVVIDMKRDWKTIFPSPSPK